MKKSILVALALILTTFAMDAQVQLQVTGEQITLTKVYDGTTNVSFTQGTLSGVQPGDTVNLTTTAVYASSNAADSVAINVTYQISGPQAANYMAPADRLLKGKITRKQLTAITKVTTHKQYDGNDTAVSEPPSVTGIVPGDDVTVSKSALYDDKNVGTYKNITISYTMSGADTANYTAPVDLILNNGSISAITTTFAIQTLLNHTKVYDGTNAVTVLNTGTVNEILPGDDAQLVATATYSAADVGTNLDITLSYSFSGRDGGNYIAPAAQLFNGVGTITSKRLTIGTPTTVRASKVYDRSTSCVVLTNGTAGGVMGSDRITLQATARYQDSLVGYNKNVIVSYQIYGQGSTNYLAPNDEILFADITPRRLTIIPCTVQGTKVYDSNTSAQLQSIGALRNIQPGDSVNLTATAQYDDKNVGTNKEIYITYTIDGPDAGNYDAPLADTVHFNTITKATVGVTGTTVQQNRSYNGKTNVTVTNPGTLASFANDNVYLSAKAWYNDKNVGTSKVITVRYTLSGLDSANYVTPADTTFTGVITQRLLTMEQHSTVTSTKVYDKTVSCQVATEGILAGVISGDDVRVSTTAAYLTADAGTDKPVSLAYTIYGNDSANYIAPDTAYTAADITPRQLDITPCHVQDTKVYDANISATVDTVGTLIHLIAGDSVTVNATAVYDNKNAGTNKDIYITYTIQGADAANYITPAADTVKYNTITPLTVSATGTTLRLSKTYNGKNRASVTSPGTIPYLSGDNVTLSAVAIYDNKNAGTGKHITINYSLTGPDAANYDVMSADTTGDITPLTLYFQQHSTVIPTKVYDRTTTCVKATDGVLTGVLTGDDVTLQTTAAYTTPSVGINKLVIVQYYLTGADSANYQLYSDTMHTIADITPLQLNLAHCRVQKTKIYDATVLATVDSLGSLIHLISGDSVNINPTAVYDNKNVGTDKDIYVSYTIDGPAGENYTAPATDTIHHNAITPLTVNATGTELTLSKVYNGKNRASVTNPGTIPAFVGDDVTLNAIATYDNKNVGTGKSITINYSLTGPDSANYIVSSADTTGDITPLVLTFQQHSTVVPAKVYDGTTSCSKATDGVLSGIVAGDDVTLQTSAAYITPSAGQDKDVLVRYHLSGADSANYRLSPDTTYTTADITRRQLTVSNWSVDTIKAYDENNTVHIINMGMLDNAIASDQLVLTTTAQYNTSSIDQNKSITVHFHAAGPGIANYLQPVDTVITGSITKVKLTVSGTTLRDTVYNGGIVCPVLFRGHIMNKVNPAHDVDIIATAVFNDRLAGTNKPVTVTYTLTGADAVYYDAPDPDATLKASINPLQLTASGTVLAATRPYDGTTNCQVTTNGILHGVLAGDSVTLDRPTAAYTNRHAGTDKSVTISYSISGPDAGNYIAPVDNIDSTASITAVPVTIENTAVTLVKQYDATTTAAVTNQGTAVVLNPSDIVIVTATAAYETPDIAQGKNIFVAYTLSGADAGNYIAPGVSCFSTLGEITRRKLTQTGTQVVATREYDGTKRITVTDNGSLANLLPGDSVTFTLTSAEYSDKNEGTNKEVYVRGTISGPDVSKYVLDYCDTVYADITPKVVSVNGTVPVSKVYDGTSTSGILTYGSVNGFIPGDDVQMDFNKITAQYSTIYPTNNATVTIHYTLTGDDAHNYTVNDNVYPNMVISPAPLRIRTNTLDVVHKKVYDATDSAHIADFDNTLTAADGVVGDDSVAVSAAAYYSDKNAGSGKTITVRFTLTGKDRGNYVRPSDITYNNGVITRLELTIDYNSTIVDTVKTYDGTNTAHVAYAGDIYGYIPCDSDKIELNATAFYKDAAVDSGKTITVYYSLLGTEAGNYYVQPSHTYRDKGRINPAPSDVEVVSEQFDITLAPNPARVGETTYLVSDIQGSVTIELLNAAGQRIMIEDGVTFPMEIQAPAATGIYFVRIIADDGKAYIRKLIVK